MINNLNDFTYLIDELKRFKKLTPSTKLNKVLSHLVQLANNPANNTHSLYKHLQRYFESTQDICMRAESALEYFWAEKIIRSSNARYEMTNFPYLNNYNLLSKKEAEIMRMYGSSVQNILFIGSGPLPLTAVMLPHEFNITVVDRDIKALECSQLLFDRLDVNNVSFLHSDVNSMQDFEHYDVVLLAASVGKTDEKTGIIDRLYNKINQNSLLLIRTVNGIKELLYPVTSLDNIPEKASQMGFFQFHREIINSVIAIKKCTEKRDLA